MPFEMRIGGDFDCYGRVNLAGGARLPLDSPARSIYLCALGLIRRARVQTGLICVNL